MFLCFPWQVSTDCGCWGSSTRPWSSCWSSSTAPGTAGATASASTSQRRVTSLPSTHTAQPARRSATGSEMRLPGCWAVSQSGVCILQSVQSKGSFVITSSTGSGRTLGTAHFNCALPLGDLKCASLAHLAHFNGCAPQRQPLSK